MKKRLLNLGIVSLLGIFILGVSIPVIAAGTDQQTNGKGLGYRSHTIVKILADLTGKDAEAIRTERQSGKSALELAKENGVAKEELIGKIIEANTARLKEKLNDGTITQEQYDMCINQMEQKVRQNIEKTTLGRDDKRQNGEKIRNGEGKSKGQRQVKGQARGMGHGNCQMAFQN